ncbi:MAG: SDR family NAD(P)-dependent oxidoreductase, partial [Ekhidna sp.]
KTPELTYSATIAAFNPRYSIVSSQVELKCQQTLLATGKIQAMVRPEPIVTNLAKIKALLPPSEALKGKVALVTGASRGLGAIMAQALALQGCTVFVNFHKSRAVAEQLQASLTDAPGEIVLSQGDAGDIAWCESAKQQILQDYGRLDFLFCNAAPGIIPMSLAANTVGRINDYIYKAIAMTDIPMTTFLPLLCESSGWNIIISSIAALTYSYEELNDGSEEYPHYSTAKYAIEALTRNAAFKYQQVGFMLVRPIRLLTDFINTPYNNQSLTTIPEVFVLEKVIKPLLDKSVVKPSGKAMIVQ